MLCLKSCKHSIDPAERTRPLILHWVVGRRKSTVNFSSGKEMLLRCCPQLTNTKHVKNIKILFFILQFNITVSVLHLVLDNAALSHNQH